MAAVLVTGASGFVGGHLVEALVAQGDRVQCAVRATSDRRFLESLDVELCEADLRDDASLKRAVRGIDVVYHLAARTTARRAADLMQANAVGTANLVRACASRGSAPRLIHVSSVAAAGPTRRGGCRTEAEPPAPISNYGRSKRAGEVANALWAHAVPSTVVRPGIVLGPRNRELWPMFQGISRTRTHLVPTLAPPPLSLIEVSDLVRLLLAAAEKGQRLPARRSPHTAGQGYYFACLPEFPNYRELGRLVADAVGCPRLAYFHLGQPLPWMLGLGGQLAGAVMRQVPYVNVDKMREATADSWACSSAQAERELGFQCSAPLAASLKATADWYRAQGWI